MATQRWTRQRAQSGPCDTLDNRWEIRKHGSRWFVVDTQQVCTELGATVVAPATFDRIVAGSEPGRGYGFSTMAKARVAAEHAELRNGWSR